MDFCWLLVGGPKNNFKKCKMSTLFFRDRSLFFIVYLGTSRRGFPTNFDNQDPSASPPSQFLTSRNTSSSLFIFSFRFTSLRR